MEKIPEVEAAKALMTEAVSWSVMKWLREKKRVRKTADQANAALDQLNQAVKDRWPDSVRVAYASLLTARVWQRDCAWSTDATAASDRSAVKAQRQKG